MSRHSAHRRPCPMRSWTAALLFLCSAALAEPAPAHVPAAFESYELVLLYRGRNPPTLSEAESQRLQDAHLSHLRKMGEAGKMVVAGPFSDQPDPALRGLCLYRVGSLAEARRLAEADPAVKAGRLRVEVLTWHTEKGALTFPISEKLRATAPPAQSLPLESGECTLKTRLVPGVPGSPGHRIPSAQNPNGMSELSQLMRDMQGELKRARDSVARGQKVGPFASRFRKLRCAWPTDPADRNPRFDAQAQAYLTAVQELDAAAGSHLRPAFDRVLNACRTCHETSCSGAIVAIEALRLPASVLSAPPAK